MINGARLRMFQNGYMKKLMINPRAISLRIKTMDNRETAGNKTVRLGMEAKIKDFFNAGDIVQTNKLLDRYPYDKPRPNISEERAKEIGSEVLRKAA